MNMCALLLRVSKNLLHHSFHSSISRETISAFSPIRSLTPSGLSWERSFIQQSIALKTTDGNITTLPVSKLFRSTSPLGRTSRIQKTLHLYILTSLIFNPRIPWYAGDWFSLDTCD